MTRGVTGFTVVSTRQALGWLMRGHKLSEWSAGEFVLFDCLNPRKISPFSPSIIDVKFPTFSKKHRKTPVFIDINDPETVLRAGFNRTGQIYVISHGFLESGDRPWVGKLMNALLDYDDTSTVIVVDWKGGSSPPYYQAVANIRLIGNIVAHVIYCVYASICTSEIVNQYFHVRHFSYRKNSVWKTLKKFIW
jgi:Lipase